jgi:hypothetical protein
MKYNLSFFEYDKKNLPSKMMIYKCISFAKNLIFSLKSDCIYHKKRILLNSGAHALSNHM